LSLFNPYNRPTFAKLATSALFKTPNICMATFKEAVLYMTAKKPNHNFLKINNTKNNL